MESIQLYPPFSNSGLESDLCNTYFASNYSNTIPCSPAWFFRFDKQTIEIRSTQGCAGNLLGCFSLADYSLSMFDIVDVNHVRIESTDTLFIRTIHKNTLMVDCWILEPFDLKLDKLELNLDLPPDALVTVSKGSNSSGVTFISIAKAARFYIVGLRFSGKQQIETTQVSFADLNSVNNPKITAMTLFADSEQDYIICFMGTDGGMVEIWKYVNSSISYVSKISSKGPVSHISFDSNSPMTQAQRSLFVCHGFENVDNKTVPLVQLYNIGDRYTMVSINETVRWQNDYEQGQLLHLRYTKNESGYMIFTIYDTFENPDSEGYTILDIFSTRSAQRMRREIFTSKDVTSIKDIYPLNITHHFFVLFKSRMGRYLCSDDIPEETFDNLSPGPLSFNEYFMNGIFPFSMTKIQLIETTRNKFDGSLMIDKLLKLFEPLVVPYPPASVQELKKIIDLVFENEVQTQTMKNCVFYYFLKFFPDERSERFASDFGLTRPFITAVNGFWSFDNENYTDAIRCFSDPSVNLDDASDIKFGWKEKIVETLVKSGKYQESIIFFNSTNAHVWSDKLIPLIATCFIKTDILQAIKFQRKFAGASAVRFLNQIFEEVFSSISLANLIAPELNQVRLLLGATFLPFEESCLIQYCEKSHSKLCFEFILNYYIQRGRYTEALSSYRSLFKNKEDRERDEIMNSIISILPPTLRKMFEMNIVSSDGAKEATLLSQAELIRGKAVKETDLIQALKENYVQEEIENKELVVQDASSMDVDETFQSAPNSTPFKVPETMKLESPAIIPKSPASPFLQQPYTPPAPAMQPIVEKRTPALLQKFVSPRNTTKSPLVLPSKSPMLKLITASPNLNSASTSAQQNFPPLINRSPFATSKQSVSKPTLSQSAVSIGLGLSNIQDSHSESISTRITRSSSLQTSIVEDQLPPKREARSKKKSLVGPVDSPPKTRQARKRQESSESVQMEIEPPKERILRVTPARKSKQQPKLDIAEPPTTISNPKRSSKKKETTETPLRTIITRRMARNIEAE